MNGYRLIARDTAAVSLIAMLTFAVFGQTVDFDFINYDDGAMVYENPHVLGGPTWTNIRWGFENAVVGIWMPITVLSYQLDAFFFGNWAGGYHLTSVAIHTVNAILLYLVLRLMTGAAGRALAVALVFAIHPLRAESVAWIAERKDVLCGFFWLLSMLAYWYYTRKPGLLRYVALFVLAALALMSKSMAVTLPFALLLLDWWPLERIHASGNWRQTAARARRLVLEKVPLFALIAAASCIAFLTQANTQAVASLDRIPLDLRVANVFTAYARYLLHFFLPVRLSVFYPYFEQGLPLWWVVTACLFLALVSGFVLALYRHRFLATGWFWYLGTLVPVIGLVQIGAAAVANRYTYIPAIGIAIMLAWTWPQPRTRTVAWLFRGGAGLAITALALLAWWETGYYRNTETLFRRAMTVTSDNYLAYQKIGEILAEQGRIEDAVRLYRSAWQIHPHDAMSNYNLGSALIQQAHYEEAAVYLSAAVRYDPDDALAQTNLGVALLQLGRLPDALRHLEEGVRLDPDDANARINYGVGLLRAGRTPEAAAQFKKVLDIRPGDPAARDNLDLAQRQLQDIAVGADATAQEAPSQGSVP